MSEHQADHPAKQFEQSVTARAETQKSEPERLHDRYKPVGIPAVSAAAQFTRKPLKKPTQMG
jgi:hypothetical protein